MKHYYFLFCFALLICLQNTLPAQTTAHEITMEKQKDWYLEVSTGIQMSGYKKVDFIPSNYSPLIKIGAGKWFNNWLGVHLGYKGSWFNTISDNVRHYYTFLYPELLINANTFFTKKDTPRFWSIILHAGPGYFYNNHYHKSNICGNIGILNQFSINNQFTINIDIAAIIGWDIYQGNEDILPGISTGFIYKF